MFCRGISDSKSKHLSAGTSVILWPRYQQPRRRGLSLSFRLPHMPVDEENAHAGAGLCFNAFKSQPTTTYTEPLLTVPRLSVRSNHRHADNSRSTRGRVVERD